MLVYVKNNFNIILFSDIQLRDGYLPVVGSAGENLQLEPAIWFKIFIVDCILIDCAERSVKWTRKSDTTCSADQRTSLSLNEQIQQLKLFNTLYENAEFSDVESQLGDLFSTAVNLFHVNNLERNLLSSCVTPNSPSPSLVKTEHELWKNEHELWKNEEVLRLLHCYILPAVNLTLEDEGALKQAEDSIKFSLDKVQNEIKKADRGITIIENSLAKQRHAFVVDPRFENEDYIQTCNDKFLQLFLKHVQRDVLVDDSKLQEEQMIVDKLRDSSSLEEQQRLKESRKKRDEIHKELCKVQLVRENIINATGRKHVKRNSKKRRKTSVNVFQEVYVEISKRFSSEKESMHKLIMHQVRISSVREEILLAKEDLKDFGKSHGLHISLGGLMSGTNLLDSSGKPKEWITMGELIVDMISDSQKSAFQKHNRFCKNVLTKIEGSLQETNFLIQEAANVGSTIHDFESDLYEGHMNLSVSDVQVSMTSVSCSDHVKDDENFNVIEVLGSAPEKSRSTFYVPQPDDSLPLPCSVTTNNDNSLGSMSINSLQSSFPLESLINIIKDEVDKHMESMCQHIFVCLPENIKDKCRSQSEVLRNIWLCYEPFIFGKLGKTLVYFYEKTYQKKASKLYKKLDKTRFSDLGIQELWLLGGGMQKSEINSKSPELEVNSEETFIKVPLLDDSIETQKECPSESSSLEAGVSLPTKTLDKRTNSMASVNLRDSLSRLNIEDLYRCANQECDNISDIVPGMAAIDIDSDGTLNFENLGDQAAETSQDHQPPSYDEVFADETLEDTELVAFQRFLPVVEHFRESVAAVNITSKVKHIGKGFETMNKEIQKMKTSAANADDILAVVLLILVNLDMDTFTQLHAHVNMMSDMVPKFLSSNMYAWSLAQLLMGYQYLFGQQVFTSRSSRE